MFPWLERFHQGVKSRVESPLVVSLAASQRPIELHFNPSPDRPAPPLLYIRHFPRYAIVRFGRAGSIHRRSMVGGNDVAVPGCACACAADGQGPVVDLLQSGR